MAGSGTDLRRFLTGYVRPGHPVMREVTAALAAATGTDLSRAPRGVDGFLDPDLCHPAARARASPSRAGHRRRLSPEHAGRAACAERWPRSRGSSPAAGAWTRG